MVRSVSETASLLRQGAVDFLPSDVNDCADELATVLELDLEREERNLAEGIAAGKEEKDLVVSLQQHADVQMLLELLFSWAIFPLVAEVWDVFGHIGKWKLKAEEEHATKLWADLRRPSKTLKIEPGLLFRGIKQMGTQEPLEKQVAMERAIRYLKISCKYSSSALYELFVPAKFLPDIYLVSACLGKETQTWQTERKGIPIQARVTALLSALQNHASITSFFQSYLADISHSRQETVIKSKLGGELSMLVGRRGGVLSVMLEMLSNVPHGNIQAFQKVSELITAKQENLHPVCAQIVLLCKQVQNDKDPKRSALVRRSVSINLNSIAEKYGIESVRELVLEPLLRTLDPASKLDVNTDIKDHESQFMKELEFLFQILDAAPPSQPLLIAVEPFMCAAFELYAFSHEFNTRGGGEAKAIWELFLTHSDPKFAASLLRTLASIPFQIGTIGNELSCTKSLQKFETDGFYLQNGSLISVVGNGENSISRESGTPLRKFQASPNFSLVHSLCDAESGAHNKSQMAFPEFERANDTLDSESDPSQENCILRVKHLINLARKKSTILSALFTQCVDGIGGIFEQPNISIATLANIEFLNAVLDEKSQIGLQLSHKVIDIHQVVESTKSFMEACVSALGLWTYEKQTTDSVTETQLGVFALNMTGLAVAIVASLASYESTSELWSQPSSGGLTRFQALSPFIEPLTALSRADQRTAATLLRAHGEGSKPLGLTTSAVELCSEIAEMAMAVRVSILSGPIKSSSAPIAKTQAHDNEESDFVVMNPIQREIDQAKTEIASSEPVTRAMGIDKLRFIALPKKESSTSTVPVPGDQHLGEIVDILSHCLLDEDMYVYLTCIRAMSAVCEASPTVFFPRFIELFVGTEKLPMNGRLRLGEVLKLSAHKSGKSLPYFAPRLINAYVRGASSKKWLSSEPNPRTDVEGKVVLIQEVESPQHTTNITSGSTESVNLPLSSTDQSFRTSCLANLADTCSLAPWAAFQQASTILQLIKGILVLESKDEQAVSPRRAAAYVLLQMVNGALSLGTLDAIHEIPGELREILRLANSSSTYDQDSVVRLHCDRARAALDKLMKKFFLPEEQPKVLKVSLGLEQL